MSSVLVGMFDTEAAATQARSRLLAAGFASDAVTMTGGTPMAAGAARAPGSETPSEGGISSWFKSLFGDDDHPSNSAYSDTYGEAVRRGGHGVSVAAANDSEMDEAEQILNECGAVDIDEKSEAWKKEGWTGAALGSGLSAARSTLPAGDTQKLQEVEEELKVGKRAVAKGGVRIFTRMTEVPVTETVRLREEHADVKRTAVDRPATEADFDAFKEGSIEVREMSEEAVVSKTARVTGEVEVGKTSTERDETVRETVRKTKVDIEQLPGNDTSDRTSTSDGSYREARDTANRDPITGAPGAHPVGTAVGAAAGGVAAGAAVGSVAGPVGTVAGAAIGAVAGGLAGKGAAEAVDPTSPDAKTTKKSY